ncbi:MAG: hypothetical protein HUU16_19320 [Candidatus Omnitrophica bacterium]|nr:hypothetical protein [Candidatus Omnitrophota bacterium]
MYPTSNRSELHFDDIEGATFLYPSSNLSDLLPVSMLYPLYASPDSSGPLAARIRNAGFPSSITIETTVYVSNTPDFSAVTTYIGKEDVHLETSDPVTVHFPRRAFGQAGPLFFGLEVDSARQAFESDETNNLLVVEIPIVPWEANGDENLSGRVEGLDLFEFSRHWLENYQLPWRYRFDFDPRNHVEEDDLLALLGRWRNGTLPR